MADEPTLEGSEQDVTTPAETPAVQPDATPPEPTDTSVGGEAATGEPSGQDDFVTIRDAAKELGYDVNGLDDDDAVIRRLVDDANTARQVQPYLPQLQSYIQNAAAFEEYQRGQQALATPQTPTEPPAEEKLWDAPEFNPMWLSQVTQDEQGGIVPLPAQGGTPAIAQKVQEYFTWRGQMQDQFWRDPFAFMEPYLERRDKKLREEMQTSHQEMSAEEREQAEIQQFIRDNASWMYERDAQGQIAIDPIANKPKFSAAGTKFAKLINEADEMKMSPAQQRRYAMRLLAAEGGLPEVKQPTDTPGQPAASPEASDAQRKQDFLASAAGATPSAGASTIPTPDSNGNTQPQNERLTLDEMLTKDLAAAGITNQDLENRY